MTTRPGFDTVPSSAAPLWAVLCCTWFVVGLSLAALSSRIGVASLSSLVVGVAYATWLGGGVALGALAANASQRAGGSIALERLKASTTPYLIGMLLCISLVELLGGLAFVGTDRMLMAKHLLGGVAFLLLSMARSFELKPGEPLPILGFGCLAIFLVLVGSHDEKHEPVA